MSFLAYPTDRAAYGRLSRLITLGRRRSPKGKCEIHFIDVLEWGKGMVFLAVPPSRFIFTQMEIEKVAKSSPGSGFLGNDGDHFTTQLSELNLMFPGNCYLIANHLLRGDDTVRLAELFKVAKQCGTPLVAANDVHMHTAARRPLADVVACIREKCTLDDAGFRLSANSERRLKPPAEMALLFRNYPDAIARTVEIAERCCFSLDELSYEYPDEVAPDGRPPQTVLEDLTWEGAKRRYPDGVPDRVCAQVKHELQLIKALS